MLFLYVNNAFILHVDVVNVNHAGLRVTPAIINNTELHL